MYIVNKENVRLRQTIDFVVNQILSQHGLCLLVASLNKLIRLVNMAPLIEEQRVVDIDRLIPLFIIVLLYSLYGIRYLTTCLLKPS